MWFRCFCAQEPDSHNVVEENTTRLDASEELGDIVLCAEPALVFGLGTEAHEASQARVHDDFGDEPAAVTIRRTTEDAIQAEDVAVLAEASGEEDEAVPSHEDTGSNSEQTSEDAPPLAGGIEAKLDRGASGRFGLKIETISGVTVIVSAVLPDGVAEEYNRRAPEAMRIKAGDVIHIANGKRNANDIRQLMKEATTLELVFAHQRVFKETVRKRGRPLGLMVRMNLDHGSGLLFVAGIKAHCAVWSSRADIVIGDLILAVNGKVGDAKMMLQEAKSSKMPVFTIARPCT